MHCMSEYRVRIINACIIICSLYDACMKPNRRVYHLSIFLFMFIYIIILTHTCLIFDLPHTGC